MSAKLSAPMPVSPPRFQPGQQIRGHHETAPIRSYRQDSSQLSIAISRNRFLKWLLRSIAVLGCERLVHLDEQTRDDIRLSIVDALDHGGICAVKANDSLDRQAVVATLLTLGYRIPLIVPIRRCGLERLSEQGGGNPSRES